MQVSVNNQLTQNVPAALSGNTSAAASTIIGDAAKLASADESGNMSAISQDTATLENDANAAASSGAITWQQQATVLLPAQEDSFEQNLAASTASGGGLAQLFQRYCEVNNLPITSPQVQASWNQFINDMSSSLAGMSSPAAQAAIQSAEQFCVGDAPTSSPNSFPNGGFTAESPGYDGYTQSSSVGQPDFYDAASIESALGGQSNNSHAAYLAVQSSPTNQNAVNAYVNALVTEAQSEGAGPNDLAAVKFAASTALHDTGVSDSAISTALAQVSTGTAMFVPNSMGSGIYSQSSGVVKPNFSDASSIQKALGWQTDTSSGAYTAVLSSPTNQNAVNAYVNDLVTEAQGEGAGASDRGAIDAAATAALHGAGVSDSAISSALAQNSFLNQ